MPTPRESAPFDLELTGGRSQPSPQAALRTKVIRRIAELRMELLNIVHDNCGVHLPTVTPVFPPLQHYRGDSR
jgi:hypothetical protein